MEKVLVTGGTGLLGSEVVKQLLAARVSVGVLSSRISPPAPDGVAVYRGDLRTGEGLAEALAGAETVIHCASNFAFFDDIDIKGTANLLRVMDRAHLVYISIVGVDRSVYPYYVAKRAVEEMILESGVPGTILRTTQWHPFVLKMIHSLLDTGDDVVVVPEGIRFQSVDLGEVAAELIRIARSAPAGLLPAFGGPEVLRLEEMFEAYLGIVGSRRQWKVARVAGLRYDNFRTGINIVPEHRSGKVPWMEFLRANVDG